MIFLAMTLSPEYPLHKCNRCGYEWYSKNKKPNTCADRKCRSKYWNWYKVGQFSKMWKPQELIKMQIFPVNCLRNSQKHVI